jgi:hypothetical protein
MTQRAKQRARDYKIAFGTEEGQRVLSDLVASSFTLSSTLSPDPYETAFNEGMRNATLRILAMLHYKPEDFMQLPEKVETDE